MPKIDLLLPVPQRKTYKPVGCCIYCGRSADANNKLSREHIIAHGLTGTLILPEASCVACRDVTGKIEGFYMQKMIRDARIHLKLASRRHRRNKSPPPPLFIKKVMGGIERRIEMAPQHHPYWLIALGYAPPGVLVGAGIDYAPLIEHRSIPGENWPERWAGLGPGIAVEYEVDSNLFARMLAKIAHSFSVANLGFGGFDAVLPPIILGQDTRHPQYVGGYRPEDDNRTARPGVLHSIELSRRDGWAVVHLRLFAHLEGTPNYTIVAGRVP